MVSFNQIQVRDWEHACLPHAKKTDPIMGGTAWSNCFVGDKIQI